MRGAAVELLSSGAVSRRSHRTVLWVTVVVMILLHLDPFEQGQVEPVVAGWIPRDLGYHLAWVVAAAVITFYLCAKVWPDEE